MRLTQQLGIAAWRLRGRFGWQVSLDREGALTALVAYHHPARAGHCAAQVRSLLKCSFVERVIIAKHNPLLRLELPKRLPGDRVTLVDTGAECGCGRRWHAAASYQPQYLLVIDDDVFLFPEQIAALFRHLLDAPDRPHGLAGMRRQPGGGLDYHCQEDSEVDFLCETYAVTLGHLLRYLTLEERLLQNGVAFDSVDKHADFAVLSRTGASRPAIHDLGHVFRCPTFKTPGVAVHRSSGFQHAVDEVTRALDALDAVAPRAAEAVERTAHPPSPADRPGGRFPAPAGDLVAGRSGEVCS